ncbi:hypothetical protein BDY21DRAFT_346819 [Lineolata rhizophorae]|uniref:Uncharacterized protein n=1 Tax=Lineolata rhizophorae TaxID=578093 RepID=A0A6A6NX43_9PEZI|nr:hypothetical protein BDY21DRAFT_346819 [Lineolata rhizophorae]
MTKTSARGSFLMESVLLRWGRANASLALDSLQPHLRAWSDGGLIIDVLHLSWVNYIELIALGWDDRLGRSSSLILFGCYVTTERNKSFDGLAVVCDTASSGECN